MVTAARPAPPARSAAAPSRWSGATRRCACRSRRAPRRPLRTSSSRAAPSSAAVGRCAGASRQAESTRSASSAGTSGRTSARAGRRPPATLPSVSAGVSPRSGLLAGEQLVEHHAGRVHVALRPDAPAARLLRRHVGDRADDVAVGGERVAVQEPCDAEVHHLHVAVAVQHHVLGLHVAVDDALAVGEGQSFQQLGAHGGHVAVAELPDELVQRHAVDQLPDEVAPLAVAEPVVERDDVGMREGRGRLDLADDAARHAPALGDDLQRDGLVELQVAGLEDLGETAAADASHDLVAVAPVGVQRGRAVG